MENLSFCPSTPPEKKKKEASHCPDERRKRTKATNAEVETGGSVGGGTDPSRKGGSVGV